jgi:hypothetical protein
MPAYVIHAGLYQIRMKPKSALKDVARMVKKLEASGHFQEVKVYELDGTFKFKLRLPK